MKKNILLSSLVIMSAMISGCASSDGSESQTTTQQYDLRDLDGDGVIEARDQCPNSVAGSFVNNVGCGKEKEISDRVELKLNFANNSAVIKPVYQREIEAIANFMHQYPDSSVTIEGHCSKTGSYELNMALSQARAEAVVDMLKNTFFIDANRLQAIGYGYTKPIDDSETEIAAERNRRVIAAVSGTDKTIDMKWDIYSVDTD
ncbi:OmpA family protein [Photobacterium angustum]|uniref:OmpA-like domain-containing protein n=1 Tax=Photobacterium angustum TaxID=661 RepID=A0A2S7VY06_PHOAN|nr:OmpA family protein [Photobacterium angustum]PQJ66990.1 hypothetical protein BTO08_05875 [Photobacterium angustum]